jgi:hypothetical protein
MDGDADWADAGVAAVGAADARGVAVRWGVGWGVAFTVGFTLGRGVGWGVGCGVGWGVTTGDDFGFSGFVVGGPATTGSGATIEPTPLRMIMAAVTASASTSRLSGGDARSARLAKA